VLKTKSEIYGLSDFIQWLENVKGNADGVILVSHEPRKVAVPLLLEALHKYSLLERFSAVVKGFANGYRVAEVKCAKTVRSFSLRTLSRVLLNNEEDLDNAADRARLAFQVRKIKKSCEHHHHGLGYLYHQFGISHPTMSFFELIFVGIVSVCFLGTSESLVHITSQGRMVQYFEAPCWYPTICDQVPRKVTGIK
jgi:hypothetical protein